MQRGNGAIDALVKSSKQPIPTSPAAPCSCSSPSLSHNHSIPSFQKNNLPVLAFTPDLVTYSGFQCLVFCLRHRLSWEKGRQTGGLDLNRHAGPFYKLSVCHNYSASAGQPYLCARLTPIRDADFNDHLKKLWISLKVRNTPALKLSKPGQV